MPSKIQICTELNKIVVVKIKCKFNVFFLSISVKVREHNEDDDKKMFIVPPDPIDEVLRFPYSDENFSPSRLG